MNETTTTQATAGQALPVTPEYDVEDYSLLDLHGIDAQIDAALAAARAKPANAATLLAGLLNAAGRHNLTITLDSGRLVQLAEVNAEASASSASDPDAFISMSTASKLLHHGPTYLSRKLHGQRMWQLLGLNPRRSGRNLLFKRREIIEHIEKQVVRRRGRPRSMTANVSQ